MRNNDKCNNIIGGLSNQIQVVSGHNACLDILTNNKLDREPLGIESEKRRDRHIRRADRKPNQSAMISWCQSSRVGMHLSTSHCGTIIAFHLAPFDYNS